jgi:hypothetical protein
LIALTERLAKKAFDFAGNRSQHEQSAPTAEKGKPMTVDFTAREAELLRDLTLSALAGRGMGNKYTDDQLRAAKEKLNDALKAEA